MRACPSCARAVVAIADLLLGDTHCPSCGRRVGVHRLFGAAFSVLIFFVTAASTLAILLQFGMFAALFWLPFPVGAIGYLKARFSPLVTRARA